jgi:hypothetical protein
MARFKIYNAQLYFIFQRKKINGLTIVILYIIDRYLNIFDIFIFLTFNFQVVYRYIIQYRFIEILKIFYSKRLGVRMIK